MTETFEMMAADPAEAFLEAFSRPRVVCDIDGVLADYCSAACEAVNGHFNTAYTPMIWTSYAGPFNPAEYDWLTAERFSDDAFWMAEAPNPAAIWALNRLAEAGYEIVVSSERPATAAGATVAWLQFHQVPSNDVHLVGPGGKVALCGEARTVLIDDSPARWSDCAGPECTVLSPRTPYTVETRGYDHVVLFSSYFDVPGLVKGIVWPV